MAMKIGAEDKKKVAILAVLLAVVVGLVVYNLVNLFGGGSSSPSVVPRPATVSAPAAPARAAASSGARPRPISNYPHEATRIAGALAGLDPTLHPELMAQAESIEYTGKGRNIFSMYSEPVIEQVKQPIRQQNIVPVQTGPPPPPPIDLKFFGYETRPGGVKKAFLLHGDDVFIAGEGDVVDHHYKVVRIAPLSVQIEDIPYNNTQSLPLIQN
ncbi:MAG: hypothetical protein JOZ83_01830 [Silvibacterium sp.]|nr:hypothetical protein [Silvibacterium sp.]